MFAPSQVHRESPLVDLWSKPELLKVYRKGNPVCLNFEINKRCAGGCAYCYASSTNSRELRTDDLPYEKFVELIERMQQAFGTKVVYLYGGDQLLHPDLKKMVYTAIERGYHLVMPLAGLISPTQAAWLVEAHRAARARN